MMSDVSGQEVRNDRERARLVSVECEICDRAGLAGSDQTGVYICAACHRDIVSSHIHD
jgi:hypothetical protein